MDFINTQEFNDALQVVQDFEIYVNGIDRDLILANENYRAAVMAYDPTNIASAINFEKATQDIGDILNGFLSKAIPVMDVGLVFRAKRDLLTYNKNPQVVLTLTSFISEYIRVIESITVKYDAAYRLLQNNSVITDFRDVVVHPYNAMNMGNLVRHSEVLSELVDYKNAMCASIVPNPDPANIYTELAHITYANTANDSILYARIGCDVLEILRKNTHSFMVGNKFRIPVESKSLKLDLRENRVISDSSVEGVVWTVGYGGNPIPFATMKYAKPIVGPKSNNMIHELVIGFILNTLRDRTPNFMYVWAGFSCSIPTIGAPLPPAGAGGGVLAQHDFNTLCDPNTAETMETIILAEVIQVHGSFQDLLQSFSDPANPKAISWFDIVSIVFQLLSALSIAQSTYRFVHGDLHRGNVLIKRLPAPVTLSYNLGGNIYSIPTQYIAIVIDYGFCRAEFNGKVVTQLIYGWNGEMYYGAGQPENNQINPAVFMPLYDIARLLQGLSGTPRFDALDRVLSSSLGIPSIAGLKASYADDPSIFDSPVANPMEVMAINLYRSSVDPRGILSV